MRIFSPLDEMGFAGHPIMATAFVLGSCGNINLTETIKPVVFEHNVGPINVKISANEGKPIFVQFSRKVSFIIDPFAATDEELTSFLSIQQWELNHKKYSPRLVSCTIIKTWIASCLRN